MKQFAKSLVSVVIALSILATMCIVGISVSAEETDTNEVGITAVSANLTKDVNKASVNGAATNLAVVNTSQLTGGTAGVPAKQAYKVTVSAAAEGVKYPVVDTDWSAFKAATNTSGTAGKGYGINAWIWVSDASKVGAPIFRFFAEGNANWAYQMQPAWGVGQSTKVSDLVNGWNNIILWFPESGDVDHTIASGNHAGGDGLTITNALLADWAPTGQYDLAVGCIRIITTADSKDAAWEPAPVVYPTDKEYLVYGLDREEGVTIGDWQDVTYDGGKGAFKTTTSNRVKKYLPKSVDLTGKTVTAWIYVPEGATPAGQFELCTVDQDNGEFTFDSNTFGLKAGWNKVILDPNNKKDTAGVAEGAVGYRANDASSDVADINVVRYYDANADFMLGAVYVTPVEPEKDANKVGKTIISANVDKKADDMTANGNATKLSVVKTSELKGGTSGVPSEDAYKFTVGAGTNGLVLPVVNTDWTAVNDSTNADGSAGKDYGVNAWVYISDASKVNGLIFRFFDENNSNWNYQISKMYDSSSTQSYVNGWNNITFWFPTQNRDHDHALEGGNVAGGDGKTVSTVLVCDYSATGGYDFAIACARLITKSDDANAGWTVGSATGDATDLAVVVVAILLAAMAASVTVYFGKKVR